MATVRKSRAAWIAAAAAALGDGGVDSVRVERLARALKVTKGSFYWHFQDRDELLGAVLQTWEQAGTEAVIETVNSGGGDAGKRLRRLWALTTGDENIGQELAIRDWGRRDERVGECVKRVDNRRLSYLRELFCEHGLTARNAEARSILLYSLLIGNYFIAASHGRRSRRAVLGDALDALIDAAPPGTRAEGE